MNYAALLIKYIQFVVREGGVSFIHIGQPDNMNAAEWQALKEAVMQASSVNQNGADG